MKTQPTLSIVTPSIWSRVDQARKLSDEIERQTLEAGLSASDVEHIVLMDNRSMTIGEKRNRCFDSARGRYVAFVDDDDWILPGYVSSIVNAARVEADVITFRQTAYVDDKKAEVIFRLGQPDEPFADCATIKRGPWHICAWRKELVATCRFLHTNYGEDIAWAMQARQLVRRGAHIDHVLHEYRHSSQTTAAPMPC